jgi:hypothetical protein
VVRSGRGIEVATVRTGRDRTAGAHERSGLIANVAAIREQKVDVGAGVTSGVPRPKGGPMVLNEAQLAVCGRGYTPTNYGHVATPTKQSVTRANVCTKADRC